MKLMACLLATTLMLGACSTDKVKSAASCAKTTAEVTNALRSALQDAAQHPDAAAASGEDQVATFRDKASKLADACGDSSGAAVSTAIVLASNEAAKRTGDSQIAAKAIVAGLCQAGAQLALTAQARAVCDAA